MRNNNLKIKVSSQALLLRNHGFHAVVHVLDQICSAPAQSPPVRDIVNMVSTLRMFSVDASDLDVELLGNSFKLILLRSEFRQLDMD